MILTDTVYCNAMCKNKSCKLNILGDNYAKALQSSIMVMQKDYSKTCSKYQKGASGCTK